MTFQHAYAFSQPTIICAKTTSQDEIIIKMTSEQKCVFYGNRIVRAMYSRNKLGERVAKENVCTDGSDDD